MKILKLALRSLLHFRVYSVINILGLALGLSCVIIIARYVYGELTIDHFKKNDRIFLVTEENSDGAKTTYPFYLLYRDDISHNSKITNQASVDKFSSFVLLEGSDVVKVDQKGYNAISLVTDTAFFSIIDFPLIRGSVDLSNIKTTAISKKFAEKVFGKENPIDKTIEYNGELLTITGIIETEAVRNSLNFDIVVSDKLADRSRIPSVLVLLKEGSDYKITNKELSDFNEIKDWNKSVLIRHQLLPLGKLYFSNQIVSFSFSSSGNKTNVLLLLSIGLIVLLIACINFVNIYTVAIMRRGREFGMKKVFGAKAINIFIQLFIENISLIAVALFLAFTFTELFSPLIKNNIGLVQYPYKLFDLLFFISLLVSLPFLTSIYPFIRYNYSSPINSLQKTGRGKLLSRKFILSFQYVITVCLIVVSLFFLKQLRFLLNSDQGILTKNIVKVPFFKEGVFQKMEEEKIGPMIETIRQKLNEYPFIEKWTFSESPIKSKNRYYNLKFKSDSGEERELNVISTDSKWQDLFCVKLKEGRLWDPNLDKDFQNYNLIVTESVLKEFGISDYTNQALQPESRLWTTKETFNTNPPYSIVGVVEDFFVGNLSEKSIPIALTFSTGDPREPLLASIAPGHTNETIEFLEKLHNETVGGEFEYSFIEDDVKALYTEDKKVAIIYSAFTLVAILISALGLFGMSLYDIQRRYKEIAIRKVNGANVKDILGLLLMKYLKLLVMAFLFATPLAWFAVYKYSENFARKTNLSWWIFALAFVVTAGISLLTLIYQTQKAANTNPSEVVRMEN